MVTIARDAHIRAEIYHLKAAGKENWPKLDQAIERIEAAQKEGLEITADMYTYTAGSTGLDAAMPPWVQEGGYKEWAKRLQDPKVRERLRKEMTTPTDAWENLMLAAGGEGTLLVGFKNEALRGNAGKTLAEVARLRGKPVPGHRDGSGRRGRQPRSGRLFPDVRGQRQEADPPAVGQLRIGCVLDGARGRVRQDQHAPARRTATSPACSASTCATSTSSRSKRRCESSRLLPATTLQIKDRGRLAPEYFADVVVFDPKTMADKATYEQPHQYSVGMRHVWVNGVRVLKDGEHTGAKPGRVVRGPGWKPRTS